VNSSADFFTPSDKVVVVVGGTGKVGNAIVSSLIKSGAIVVSVSRGASTNVDDADYSKFPGALYKILSDATTESGIESIKEFLHKNNLTPNVLINALSYRPHDRYLSQALDKWDDVVLKNSRSTYMLCKIFGDLMQANGGGSIINISSIYGVVAPDPALYDGLDMGTEADYPFIKAGCLALTRYFASYYGSRQVRFNSIILGGVFNDQDPEFVRRYIAKVPLARMATKHDICGAIHFLASDASSYITGASIPVDGGYTSR